MATEGKSSKEVRSLLKKAKECVTQSDYAPALIHVDNALSIEQDNCNGLVLKGFILMKQGEGVGAEEVLWRAVDLQEGLVSAWQGLKELYEREGGTETKKAKVSLCKVYKRLLGIHADETKQLTTVEKLANIQIRLDLKQDALYNYLSFFSLCITQGKQQQIVTYWHRVVEICIDRLPRMVVINDIYPQIQEFYLNLTQSGPIVDILLPYIELLYRIQFLSEREPSDLIPHAIEVLSQLRNLDEIPEKIISFSHEMVLIYLITSNFKLNIECCNFLFSNDNALFSVLKLVDQEKFIEPFAKLESFSEFQTSIIPGRLAKLICLFETYQYPDALELCYEELKWLKGHTAPCWFHIWYKSEVLIILIHTYLEMGSINQTRYLFEDLIGIDGEQRKRADFLKTKLLVSEKKFEEAVSILEALKQYEDNSKSFVTKLICLNSEILSQTGHHEESVELMRAELSTNATSHLCYLQLGVAYWESGIAAREDKEKCLKSFLKAFSLNQLHYRPMLYIGIYYNLILVNKAKSRKCFEKACQLAPWSNEVGQTYGDLLLDLGQEEDALDFYRSLSSKISPNMGQWVWLRLGLSERKVRNYTEAIRCFQNALNCDEQDPHVLECLGEVYLVKGSLKSALACFEAVLGLESTNLFCQYQVGCIRRQAGELDEAVEMFEKVLELDASYVPALLGAAECHYQISVVSLHEGLRPTATSHLERGLQLAAKCAEFRNDYSAVWYCIGEIGMLGRHFGVHAKFVVPSSLSGDLSKTMCGPVQLLKLSIKAFLRCIELSPHHASLLYNLSLAHYYTHCLGKETDELENGTIDEAYKYCVNAIILMDTDWKAWNLLGLILLCKEPRQSPLIQHCFIKSLSIQSSYVTWTNLGYFYLTEDKSQFALKCFENARSIEPLAIRPWMGLAFVYQIFDKQRESLGLLRHLNAMGYNAEAALWFAWRVCEDVVKSAPNQIYNENGEVKAEVMVYILLSRDRLEHYSLHHPLNTAVLNMLAVLYELEGLYVLSEHTLSTAIHHLQKESEEFSKVVTNLIRVRNKARRTDCDRELLFSLHRSPTNLLQQSISLFYSKQYTECMDVLNELSKVVESEEDKNDVKIMVGLAANLARDQRVSKGTLALLSKSKHPLHACTALCCIGVVYGDSKMLEGALGQMHELCCGDWGAPPCYNLQQVLLVLRSLLAHYSCEKGRGDLVKKLEELVAQLGTKEPESSIQTFELLSELEEGSLPVCVATQVKLTSSFIEPLPPDNSDIEEEIPVSEEVKTEQEPKEKLVPPTTTQDLIRRAQKLIHSNPDDVTNWVSLIVAVAYQVWLSPDRNCEAPYFHMLVQLLSNLIERTKEGSSLHNWCIQTLVPLSFHRVGITPFSTESTTKLLNHPLTPVYSALASLTADPNTQLVESCRTNFQTQLAITRYLVWKNNHIPAFNAYKIALQVGKTISPQILVFALIDMALCSICWYKRYVKDKVKFPQELNLHKIAKDNLTKSKQIFPEISQLADVLLQINDKLRDEFYFVEK